MLEVNFLEGDLILLFHINTLQAISIQVLIRELLKLGCLLVLHSLGYQPCCLTWMRVGVPKLPGELNIVGGDASGYRSHASERLTPHLRYQSQW
jgi:hypothetical protein